MIIIMNLNNIAYECPLTHPALEVWSEISTERSKPGMYINISKGTTFLSWGLTYKWPGQGNYIRRYN